MSELLCKLNVVLVILGQWKNYVAAFHNCLKILYFFIIQKTSEVSGCGWSFCNKL